MDILEMEKVLVSWPDSGLQSISIITPVCWVAKSGIGVHRNCATFKLLSLGDFWSHCSCTASRWFAFGWYCVCWRHTKGYPCKVAFWGAGSSHRGPYREGNCNWSTSVHKTSMFCHAIRGKSYSCSLSWITPIFFQTGVECFPVISWAEEMYLSV